MKLCGRQRKPMGRKGRKMILGRYGEGTSLMNNIFMYKGFFKTIKMRFNTKFPFLSHWGNEERILRDGGESPTSNFRIPLLPPCFITKPSLGKTLRKRVSSQVIYSLLISTFGQMGEGRYRRTNSDTGSWGNSYEGSSHTFYLHFLWFSFLLSAGNTSDLLLSSRILKRW